MDLTVLGTAECAPQPHNDTASFCINGRVLIDTGWNVVRRLLEAGLAPTAIEAVVLTHCHHDHYLGLTGLIFEQGLEGAHRGGGCSLDVYGPAGLVARVVEDIRRLLQIDRFPELDYPVRVHDVFSGDRLDVCDLHVHAVGARHNVPGLHYRVEDAGGSVVFSGDTAYSPDLIDLARGCDLLIHEASHGAESTRDQPGSGHAGAPDAADIAARAEARALWLVHLGDGQCEAALAAARKQFAEVSVPEPLRTYRVPT